MNLLFRVLNRVCTFVREVCSCVQSGKKGREEVGGRGGRGGGDRLEGSCARVYGASPAGADLRGTKRFFGGSGGGSGFHPAHHNTLLNEAK